LDRRGLDSAYYADEYLLYSHGSLADDFEHGSDPVPAKLGRKGKKLIVMTHHNPIDHKGDPLFETLQYEINGLGQQVMNVVGADFYCIGAMSTWRRSTIRTRTISAASTG